MVESNRLQSGESVATLGAAEEDRELVPDELAAAVGEDRWASDQARPVLLAAPGREPPDAGPVWKHGAANRSVAAAERIGRGGQQANRAKEGGGDGEVYEKSLEIRHFLVFHYPEELKLAVPGPLESLGMEK